MRILLSVLLLAAAVGAQTPRRAPGFSLPDSNGQQTDLADYRGKIVLVDIMKTDCAHCGSFARKLEQAQKDYPGKVVVLAIAPAPDNPTTVAKFTAANGVTYPILFDCGQAVYSYVRPNPLRPTIELPRLYIVGPDGMILRDFAYGPQTMEFFEGRGLWTELDRIVAAPKKK